MPCPEKKISCHKEKSTHEIKLNCSVEVVGKEQDEKAASSTSGKEDYSKPCPAKSEEPKGKICSATPDKKIEPQAVLNKESCPNLPGFACQLVREDPTSTRLCENAESGKPGCLIDFEDPKDFEEVERKKKQEKREEAKKKKQKRSV